MTCPMLQRSFIYTRGDTQRDEGVPHSGVELACQRRLVFNKKSQIFLVLHKISAKDDSHLTGFPLEFDCLIGPQARRIGPPALGLRKVVDSKNRVCFASQGR
jgi:hypothetical protein